LKTTVGAAQSVAVAIDKAEWPEVAGTISGDDTCVLAVTTTVLGEFSQKTTIVN
jgi:arginine repressor